MPEVASYTHFYPCHAMPNTESYRVVPHEGSSSRKCSMPGSQTLRLVLNHVNCASMETNLDRHPKENPSLSKLEDTPLPLRYAQPQPYEPYGVTLIYRC